MNCQHCQQLLLDHLYGLLEGADAAAVESHLASCPACATARAETARVQGLIARAAKSAFPNTKFEAPAPTAQPAKSTTRTPVPGTPAVLPFHAKPERTGGSRRVASLLPWAVAAAVLVAIPGTIVPVLSIHSSAEVAKRNAEAAQSDADTAASKVSDEQGRVKKTLGDAEFKFRTAEQTQATLLAAWVKEEKEAVERTMARRFSVDVLKPASVTPGAPNDFMVVVNDRRQAWETTGKKMVAEIHAVDSSDAVIYTQPIDVERTGERKHPLRLPASAWSKVKPNSELYLVVAQVDEKTQTRTELQERVKLAGPVFTTLLVTDKATYRPGERLFFRSLTLDRVTLRPPTREQILKYELLHPDNTPVSGMNVVGTTDLIHVDADGKIDPVRTTDAKPVRGVGCGEFVLPPDLPEGDYTLRLTEGQHPGGFPATVPLPVTRTVKVRSAPTDNYRKEIGFAKESFVPGETVEAWAELKFQGKPQAGATVTGAAALVDGTPVEAEFAKETDKDGRVRVRFPLPDEVLNGEVLLKVTFRAAQGEESVTNRVPVIGNRVVVEFFPESGDTLVAGVPCKVYVRATTPAGQPVNFRGVVTDGRQTLAKVESLSDKDQPGANRGLASFTYTPQLGTRVWLKLESPTAVHAPILKGVTVHNAAVALMGGPGAAAARSGFELPEAKDNGVVMSVLDPITAPGEPIRVQLHSVGQERILVVGAYTRGRLSDTQKVVVEPDRPQIVKLMAGPDPRGGVVRITAFEELDEKQDLKPVAERLVFRKPGEVLNLTFGLVKPEPTGAVLIAPQAPGAQPAQPAPTGPAPGQAAPPALPAGSDVKLSITACDEKGNPVAAILWAAAVNSGVAPGTKDRLLPTHFLLAGEVKSPDGLEYADFLLTDHAKAAEALDLLLGTQGWRRFAEQSPASGVNQNGKPPYSAGVPTPELARHLVQNGQYATWTDATPIRDHRELYQKYAARYEAAVKAAAHAKAALDATREETRDTKAVAQATAAAETARLVADEKAARAESASEPVRQFRTYVWYGVAGFAALALCCGLVSYLRPATRFPLGFSTLGSVGLAAFLLVAAGWGDEPRAAAKATADAPTTPGQNELAMREGNRPQAADPVRPPLPPKGSGTSVPGNPAPKNKKDDTAVDKMPNESGGPPNAPPGGGFATKPQAGRDYRTAAFSPYPPVVLQSFGRFSDSKGGFGMGAGPIQPVAPPAPTPVVGLVPSPAPGSPAAPSAPGTGWNPNNPNGINAAEIYMAQSSTTLGPSRPTRGASHAESLKKATDLAAKDAGDRGRAMTAPLDPYFFAEPDKKGAPHKHAEVFAVQQLRAAVSLPPSLVVREFAAPRPTPAPVPGVETPDTILWQPVIVLPTDGKTTLNFSLGNAAGGYELVIAGHTADGRLGATRGLLTVSQSRNFVPAGPVGPDGQGGAGGVVLPPGSVPPPPPPMP